MAALNPSLAGLPRCSAACAHPAGHQRSSLLPRPASPSHHPRWLPLLYTRRETAVSWLRTGGYLRRKEGAHRSFLCALAAGHPEAAEESSPEQFHQQESISPGPPAQRGAEENWLQLGDQNHMQRWEQPGHPPAAPAPRRAPAAAPSTPLALPERLLFPPE